MLKSIEMSGENRDAAIEAALEKLGMQRDDVSVEVLDNGKKGFLGFGATQARVRVTYEVADEPQPVAPKVQAPKAEVPAPKVEKPAPKVEKPAPKVQEQTEKPSFVASAPKEEAPQEQPRPPRTQAAQRAPRPERRPRRDERPVSSGPKEREIIPVSAEAMEQAEQIAKTFIDGLLDKMGIEHQIETQPQLVADQLRLTISGPDMGAVIGRRGDTLDAIQYLTSLVLNNAIKEHVRISVDTENYREKRAESLERLARKVAIKVQKTHRSMTLEPMNPYERRIIHATLQEFNGVTTYSTGSEPGRRIVVAPEGGNRGRR